MLSRRKMLSRLAEVGLVYATTFKGTRVLVRNHQEDLNQVSKEPYNAIELLAAIDKRKSEAERTLKRHIAIYSKMPRPPDEVISKEELTTAIPYVGKLVESIVGCRFNTYPIPKNSQFDLKRALRDSQIARDIATDQEKAMIVIMMGFNGALHAFLPVLTKAFVSYPKGFRTFMYLFTGIAGATSVVWEAPKEWEAQNKDAGNYTERITPLGIARSIRIGELYRNRFSFYSAYAHELTHWGLSYSSAQNVNVHSLGEGIARMIEEEVSNQCAKEMKDERYKWVTMKNILSDYNRVYGTLLANRNEPWPAWFLKHNEEQLQYGPVPASLLKHGTGRMTLEFLKKTAGPKPYEALIRGDTTALDAYLKASK